MGTVGRGNAACSPGQGRFAYACPMLISVFTPTHRDTYLLDAWRCLCAQRYPQWEWVVLLNGDLRELPAEIAADPRVRAIVAPEYLQRLGVGALKRYACEQAHGEWLFELDHDDLLSPDALQRLVDVAHDAAVGFVYSDFCNFQPDGTSQTFFASYGWETYPVQANGATFTALRSFAPDASSLSAIFYAPNHFRAWRRDVYWQAGAHDPVLAVCDDYDLICRTWLTGTGFRHIAECLYFYRLQEGGENTYLQRNQEIQLLQRKVADRHLYAVIAEWCRRESIPQVDLGSAHECPAGFTNVDLGDMVRGGLPFPDNSVGCVRAFDALGRFPACGIDCRHGADGGPRCVVGVMNEIYRVLVPGGWLVSGTPSTDGRGAFQDPRHASFWNPNAFWYYTRAEQARYVPGIACRFQGTRIWQDFPTPWHRDHNILYVYADLVALKGQRQPGLCEI